MSVRFTAFAVATLSLAVACTPASGALTQADRDGIKAATDGYMGAVKGKDPEAVSKLFTEDGLVFAPNQQAVKGREEIQRFYSGFPPLGKFTCTQDNVEGSGGLAYVRGHCVAAIAAHGAPTDTAAFVEVRRKQPDGSWPVAVLIFNSTVDLSRHGQP